MCPGGPPWAAFEFVLRELIDQPGFNWATQNNRGQWSLRDVSSGDVSAGDDGKPRCVVHGAMNCVVPDRSIWRCLMCGRAAYVSARKPQACPNGCVWDYDGYDKRYVGHRGSDVIVYDCMRCLRRCKMAPSSG